MPTIDEMRNKALTKGFPYAVGGNNLDLKEINWQFVSKVQLEGAVTNVHNMSNAEKAQYYGNLADLDKIRQQNFEEDKARFFATEQTMPIDLGKAKEVNASISKLIDQGAKVAVQDSINKVHEQGIDNWLVNAEDRKKFFEKSKLDSVGIFNQAVDAVKEANQQVIAKCCGDIEGKTETDTLGKECIFGPGAPIVLNKIKPECDKGEVKSDGGSSSYYQLEVLVPAANCITVTPQVIKVQFETGDVVKALVDNDFDLGNVLKAMRRVHLAAQGKGKEGTSIEYDMKKIEYFIKKWYDNYQLEQL